MMYKGLNDDDIDDEEEQEMDLKQVEYIRARL